MSAPALKAESSVRFEASAVIQLIPRCPRCESPNPNAHSVCLVCGEPAPPLPPPVVANDVVAIPREFIPWYARAAFAIGAALKGLAERISR